MINCISLKRALFHNFVHIVFVLLPCIALLVFFVCVNNFYGIIIGIVLLVMLLGCCFPIFKFSFFIIFDLIKKQTVYKKGCEIKIVKACYLPTALFGKRIFITDLRSNFIEKIDFYLSETIGHHYSDKKNYQRVRLYLHNKDFKRTELYKNLSWKYGSREIYYFLNRKPAMYIVIDVEYYQYSKLIKSFNVYEKWIFIPREKGKK